MKDNNTQKESGLRRFAKAVMPQQLRKRVYGLNDTELNSLVDNFRSAETVEQREAAVSSIIANKNFIPLEYAHFLKIALYMNKSGNYDYIKPVVAVKEDRINKAVNPDKAADANEIRAFMQNLKEGKTKSLISKPGKDLLITNDMMKLIINAIREDKTKNDYIRSIDGLKNNLNKFNTHAQNDIKQIDTLYQVIKEKYPLLIHIVTYDDKGIAVDHPNLLRYGSYLMEKDPDFANRWAKHQGLQASFNQEIKEFVANGMKNPEEFERRMREASQEIAEIFKKDLEMMPDSIKYDGNKPRETVLVKVKELQDSLNSNNLHLQTALTQGSSIEQTKPSKQPSQIPLDEAQQHEKQTKQIPLDEAQQHEKQPKQTPLDEAQQHEKKPSWVKKVADLESKKSNNIQIGR